MVLTCGAIGTPPGWVCEIKFSNYYFAQLMKLAYAIIITQGKQVYDHMLMAKHLWKDVFKSQIKVFNFSSMEKLFNRCLLIFMILFTLGLLSLLFCIHELRAATKPPTSLF